MFNLARWSNDLVHPNSLGTVQFKLQVFFAQFSKRLISLKVNLKVIRMSAPARPLTVADIHEGSSKSISAEKQFCYLRHFFSSQRRDQDKISKDLGIGET